MNTTELVLNINVNIENIVAIYYAGMCGREKVVDFLLSRRAVVIHADVSFITQI
jgi:hypothetical protein